MLILGIDTATPWGTIALYENEDPLVEISLKVGKGGGEYLLAVLDQLVHKADRRMDQLKLIAVGTGPGSYTGIRVGLAAVKGIAAGLKIPFFGLSTLRIIAENARYSGKPVAAMINARRGEVYAALYQSDGSRLIEIDPPQAILAEQFLERIKSFSEVIVGGDGSKVYADIWRRHPGITIAPPEWDRPMAGMAAKVAFLEWDRQSGFDLNDLNPGYLKRVEAEIRLEEKNNAGQCCANGNQ